MTRLRALIREHRHLAIALLLLAFCIKAVIPAGFMVASTPDRFLTVTLCSDGTGFKTMQLLIPGKDAGNRDQRGQHSDQTKPDDRCAFSGLAQVAIGGADAFLLALAFAFLLVLGFAPVRRAPFLRIPHLLPPQCGPPATT